MEVKLQKWGNSQGVRIPMIILKELNLAVGDSIKLDTVKGEIRLKPAARRVTAVRLEDLVARIPKKHKARELDWGQPAGREEW